ncbi:phosphinothricin N-acetyltransferase [Lachnospiraceae bacterium KM106-2]|nr:phosphinothricin N-acetyltransferase [Lachnospiraceae bacterium KM106-2]
MRYEISKMESKDWEQVRKIYIEGIQTQNATFQTEAPSYESWDQGHLKECRYVARSKDAVLGWIALSPTSSRCCYAGVVEVSIYIGEKYQGMGIGTALMKQVVLDSEKDGIWSLYSAIIKENQASIALHKKCGFREIGTREMISKMPNGIWHDVVLMERRSKVVGIE